VLLRTSQTKEIVVTQSSLLAEQMRESISAMVDDEAQQLELQRVLKSGESDAAVREQWQRYQLASSLLKRQAGQVSMDTELADRVRTAMANEAELQQLPVTSTKVAWWKPVGGFAVAASVTMMMVLGVQQVSLVSQTGVSSDSGIVLLEPDQLNGQFEQASSGAVASVGEAKGQVLSNVLAIDAAEALWRVPVLPESFVLVQRSLDDTGAIAREALRFSNGAKEFTLYIEPLMGRSIAEGHAYAGQNLVFGQTLNTSDSDLFVTLVGDLSLNDAKQVAASVVANVAQ
jgi:negative regulator of sigma E activity